MPVPNTVLQAAEAVRTAFVHIHQDVFADDPNANPALQVEVIPVAALDGVFGEQAVVIVIAPWTMNAVVIPGRGLPEWLDIAGSRRQVFAMDTEALGPFAQVNLVPDVSRYGNQEQARTIAHSMVPVLLAALQPEAA